MFPGGMRHAEVTADDHGPILQVVAWFMMVVMILATMLRLSVRFLTAHIPGVDDAIVVASMIVNVGGVIAISLAVNHGLGKRELLLSRKQIMDSGKAVFASSMLYILAIALAKLSALSFIARVVPTNKYRYQLWAALVFLLMWTGVSIITYGFQCGAHVPWAHNPDKRCFNTVAFWIAATSIDVLTDVCLIVFPGWIIWDLHITQSQKRIVFGVFASRIVVIATSIVRARYFGQIGGPADRLFDSIPYHIVTQCHATLNTIITCLPGFKPFMDRANTGLLSISFKSRMIPGVYDNTLRGYDLPDLSKPTDDQGARNPPCRNFKFGVAHKTFRPDDYDQHANAFSETRVLNDGLSDVEDERSGRLVIRYTTDWSIHVHDERRSRLGSASSREL